MIKKFEHVIDLLIHGIKDKNPDFLSDTQVFDIDGDDEADVAKALNAAFILALAGGMHPKSGQAKQFLVRMEDSLPWAEIAGFYLRGIDLIHEEINERCSHDADFADRLKALSDWISNSGDGYDMEEARERIWSVFFPEGVGILKNRKEYLKALMAERIVRVKELNRVPVTDPVRQTIFTANALLTIPSVSMSPDSLSVSGQLRKKIEEISDEQQLYWYDHPIHVGVEPEKNEVLYGLHGLEEAIEFERERGNISNDERITCLLSVSVTHKGLHEIAKAYLEELITRSKGLRNIDLYVFTETDTRLILEEIIVPAALHYLGIKDSVEGLSVFGVDGNYGRHYSFLKAISAFWSILIDPEINSTFKIDLDQVFPQRELVEQTGFSAFEHLKSPLWGARGLDSRGRSLELGMIAGALVNKGDIAESLFTPDVSHRDRELSPDEYIFFSLLLQAISTEAEMMTRYIDDFLDGKGRCIQRIHVTGGTNGILVEALRRHRPFTPSFMGRAEDQAYILSVLFNHGERLAYVHKDGLVMRHDKEAFAEEAIRSARIDKLIGDYIRILYFSEYGKILTRDVGRLKEIIDPFTGCFVSKIPVSVVYLRFVLKTAALFGEGNVSEGLEVIRTGARRITDALEFVGGRESQLKRQYEKERIGWNLYYDTLSAIESGLKGKDGFASQLKEKAEGIIDQCFIREVD